MPYATPAELFDAVVDSRNRGDIETYLGCYEPNATIVLQPGSVARGHEALRGFFDFFTALKPSFKVRRREFVDGADITMHLSEWTLTGVDANGTPINWSGRTCDVLRKQSDGGWLVALDNPWGTALLNTAS
jgi:ketosteroid isomerase-like protein